MIPSWITFLILGNRTGWLRMFTHWKKREAFAGRDRRRRSNLLLTDWQLELKCFLIFGTRLGWKALQLRPFQRAPRRFSNQRNSPEAHVGIPAFDCRDNLGHTN